MIDHYMCNVHVHRAIDIIYMYTFISIYRIENKHNASCNYLHVYVYKYM